MKNKKRRAPLTLTKKIILIFISYIFIILIYCLSYDAIYFYNPSSFSFNSEIKEKQFQEVAKTVTDEIKDDFLQDKNQVGIDTLKTNREIIIRHHILVVNYVIGKDTISITDTNQIKEKARDLLLTYEKNRIRPIWNTFDFLYFSIITISTVGYGDILPNSTTVRAVVVSEIIIGQLLLIFLLGVVLSDYAIIKRDRQIKDNQINTREPD